jgi:O-antigen ligase
MLGLVLSNSRGSLVAVAMAMVLTALHRICCLQFKKFLLHYLPVLGALFIGLIALCFLLPHGITLFPGIIESLLGINILPYTSGLSDNGIGDPSSVRIPEYGENASGMQSRFAQLSGIRWTLDRKPLFGLGSNAHTRGLIRYEFRPGSWWPSHTFDMGIVAIFCQYGIVGLLGYAALYGSLFFTVIRKKYRTDPLMATFGLALITFFLCLLTISSLDSMFWILTGFIVCLANTINGELPEN